MTGNFNLSSLAARLRKPGNGFRRDPRLIMRVVLGVLLAADIAVAALVFRPWDASPEQMQEQLTQIQSQVKQKRSSVTRLRALVKKSEKARKEGDAFMKKYFMDRRTASSTIISALKEAARKAGVKAEQQTFIFQPIEGSDTLTMMDISGNYQGVYLDMVKFINLIDHSRRFLILDTLKAAPERKAGVLNMNFKMNAFVVRRPGGAGPGAPAVADPQPAETSNGRPVAK